MAARCEAAAEGAEEGGKEGADDEVEEGDKESSFRRTLVASTRARSRGPWEGRDKGISDCLRCIGHKKEIGKKMINA